MNVGDFCRTNQELSLGTTMSVGFKMCTDQKLSSVWKFKSIGLIVSIIEQHKNVISLFIVHSQGVGWITYEKEQNPHERELISSL